MGWYGVPVSTRTRRSFSRPNQRCHPHNHDDSRECISCYSPVRAPCECLGTVTHVHHTWTAAFHRRGPSCASAFAFERSPRGGGAAERGAAIRWKTSGNKPDRSGSETMWNWCLAGRFVIFHVAILLQVDWAGANRFNRSVRKLDLSIRHGCCLGPAKDTAL